MMVALAGCSAPVRLPAPMNRAEACRRINDGRVDLRAREFCAIGGAARCGHTPVDNPHGESRCVVVNAGMQAICLTTTLSATGEPGTIPIFQGSCVTNADCDPWWQCLPYQDGARMMTGCFPGPPCTPTESAVDGGV